MKVFIPGPVDIRAALFDDALQAPFGHRDSVGQQLVANIKENLLKLAGATSDEYACLLINGSGTNGMESVVRSLIPGNGARAAVLSIGSFGDLFYKIAVSCGKDKIYLYREKNGSPLRTDILERISGVMAADFLLVTHNESSTAVKNDIRALSTWAHRNGKHLIIDGVSIFGGAPIELGSTKPLAYVSSTQKCLGLPAGFSVVFVNMLLAHELISACESRGYSTDIMAHMAYAEKNEVLSTPNCSLIRQMDAQLKYIVEREGILGRFDRHLRLQEITRNWVAEMGFSMMVKDDVFRSPTLTSVTIGSAYDLSRLKNRMLTHGYLIDVGYPAVTKELMKDCAQRYFRIPHMADLTEEELSEFLFVFGKSF